MAKVILKDIKKVYPNTEKKKKAKKGEPEKKVNLQITDEGVVAVQEFNLEIADKEFIVLVGPSGCGKSTTLRMIAGLEEITSGELWIGDKLMNDVEPKDRDIAMVFQNYALYPHMTVYDNMAFSLKLKKTPKDEIDRRVKEAAAFVGLSDELLQKSPFELSGGQKRRVAIAGVMAMHPRVLVLDEPAAGLDPEGRDTILSQIRDYHEKTGITVLLVSHSMEDIAKYANRVLVMSHAKLAMYDTVEKVFGHAQELLELGLSVPQVTQIFLKLRQMGLDIPTDVYTMPYAVKTIQKALAARQAKGVQ